MARTSQRRSFWIVTCAAILATVSLRSGHAQEQKPADTTAADSQTVFEQQLAEPDAEKDDPNARLEWQRGALGIANAASRANMLREGRIHSDKKNARGPKWVNIGPEESEFDQNGSFTGHEVDSGRARTILPHPTNADIVYFLTSGGGLWRTNNWTADEIEWTPLTDDLPTTGGGSVAFGANPNTLYLGLGDFVDVVNLG